MGAAMPTRPRNAGSSSQSRPDYPQRADLSDVNSFAGIGGSASFGGSQGLQTLLNLTPTNGFNYQHLSAINSDLAEKALVDPVTQLEIAQAVRINRVLGGSFAGGAYILGDGGYYAPPQSDLEQSVPAVPDNGDAEEGQAPAREQRPQVVVLQQPPQQNAPHQAPNDNPAAQLPDEGQFTLVLVNGKQIQAIAFTCHHDKIIYITPEGGRLSITASDLDVQATMRVNQELGTPLQLRL